jgi:hypothetical protein
MAAQTANCGRARLTHTHTHTDRQSGEKRVEDGRNKKGEEKILVQAPPHDTHTHTHIPFDKDHIVRTSSY